MTVLSGGPGTLPHYLVPRSTVRDVPDMVANATFCCSKKLITLSSEVLWPVGPSNLRLRVTNGDGAKSPVMELEKAFNFIWPIYLTRSFRLPYDQRECT
jgi:hypothetical protein